MEIQVGKEYKTRDGRKVVIYATDKGGEHPVHGSVLLSHDEWGVHSWRLNGRYFLTDDDGYDITSEWNEPIDFDWDCLPKWADRFIAMDDGGNWWSYEDKPFFGFNEFWKTDLVEIEIPTDHQPKNYTGDWKDSLHENPKYK